MNRTVIGPFVKMYSLNIPQSTVSGIITTWKQLGTTSTQLQSGRPHKITRVGVSAS